MPEQTEPTCTLSATSVAPLAMSAIKKLVNLVDDDPNDRNLQLSRIIGDTVLALIDNNRKQIKEIINDRARGLYSIRSWHNDHTITTVDNRFMVSVVSTVLVAGDFELEDDEY